MITSEAITKDMMFTIKKDFPEQLIKTGDTFVKLQTAKQFEELTISKSPTNHIFAKQTLSNKVFKISGTENALNTLFKNSKLNTLNAFRATVYEYEFMKCFDCPIKNNEFAEKEFIKAKSKLSKGEQNKLKTIALEMYNKFVMHEKRIVDHVEWTKGYNATLNPSDVILFFKTDSKDIFGKEDMFISESLGVSLKYALSKSNKNIIKNMGLKSFDTSFGTKIEDILHTSRRKFCEANNLPHSMKQCKNLMKCDEYLSRKVSMVSESLVQRISEEIHTCIHNDIKTFSQYFNTYALNISNNEYVVLKHVEGNISYEPVFPSDVIKVESASSKLFNIETTDRTYKMYLKFENEPLFSSLKIQVY